jgi:hypothetical protein
MNTQPVMTRKLLYRILSIWVVLQSIAITSGAAGAGESTVAKSDCAISTSGQMESVKAKQAKAENQRAWIVFDYIPAVLDSNFEKSEFAFVAINTNGSAQAVRFGPYNPAIIGVYEGKLPKAEVALLLDKIRTVIPKASEIAKHYVGSCDADSFQLSITSQGSNVIQSKIPDFACLPVMPREIFELAQEMRTWWQRLSKVPLAYGYLRRSPFEKHLLKSAEQSTELVAVSNLSRDRRAIIRNAIKHSPKFYALSRGQYDQLKTLTRYPSHPFDFDVVDKERGYSLTLFQSRKGGLQPSKENRVDENSMPYQTLRRHSFYRIGFCIHDGCVTNSDGRRRQLYYD